MLLDFDDGKTPTSFDCDIVIVGGGAVGLSLTAELVRRGHKILVLEGGGKGLDAKSQAIYTNARSTGVPLEGLHSGRYRFLGGTSNFWGGQLVPFSPIVFEARDWAGCKGWPVDHKTLSPYYQRAMALLGLADVIPNDAKVWERAGTVPPDFGDDLELFFTRWAPVPNLARHFREDIESDDATILLHANVIGFSRRNDVAGHDLHVRTMNGRRGVVRARRVILACGTIEISRLLLMPYVDGSATPWNDNPWLGRAYIDHVDVTVGSVKSADLKRFNDLFENIFLDGLKYNPKLRLSDNTQRRHGLLQASGEFIYRTSYRKNVENLRIFLNSIKSGKWPSNILAVPEHLWAVGKVSFPLIYRYLRHHRMFHPSDASIILRLTAEQTPLRESHIVLRSQCDVLGMPMIDVHWAVDGNKELQTFAHCAISIRNALSRLQMAEIELDPRILACDPAIFTEAGDTNHQMGGARMADTESDGVVDQNLKVFGAGDLYVAGAAVMPSSGFANCTLTAIALAIRLADHLSLPA